jgi:hypothetical protein
MPSFKNVTDEQIEEFGKYLGKKLDLIVEAFKIYDFLSKVSKKEISIEEKFDRSVRLVDEATELAETMNVPKEKRQEFCERHVRNESFYGLSEFSRDNYNNMTRATYN